MKYLVPLLVVVLLSCQSSKNTKSEDASSHINFNLKKKVLDNGLTIIAVENRKLPIFSYYTFYKVGGKYETEGITGASHFLEHMMFKGAKKYKMGEFDKLVEGNGGNNNAYTSNDLTVYYENLPKEHLAKMIDIEADRMENLTLDPKAFESERAVVLEERRMRYENSDRGKIFLAMMKEIFKGTAYGTSVIGKIKDLKTMTRDQIYAYFKKYYAPNNAVIVIVGDIDADDTIDLVSQSFAKIPAFDSLNEVKKKAIDAKGFKFKQKFGYDIKLKGSSPNPMFSLAYPGIKLGPRESFALDILSSILGDGASSYLSQKFVLGSKPSLANVYAANYTLQDGGIFFIGGQLLKGKSLKKLKSDMRRTVARDCKKAMTPRSLAKIKNQYMLHMLNGLDKNAGIAKFLGNREVFFGDHTFYKKELEIYQSITVDELKLLCDKYFDPSRSLFLSIWAKH